MPILGLVADLRLAETVAREALVEWLGGREGFSLGAMQDGRLPLVLDRNDKQAVDEELRALSEREGVCNVEVIYVDFQDVTTEPDASSKESSCK